MSLAFLKSLVSRNSQYFWAALAAISTTATRFLVISVLGRTLPAADFGRFVYLQWLVDFTFLIGSAGICSVSTRFFSELRDRPATLRTFALRWRWLGLVIPFFSAILAVVFTVTLANGQNFGPLLPAFFFALLVGLQTIGIAALNGLQAFRTITSTNLAGFIAFCFIFFFSRQGGNLSTAIAALSAGAAFTSILVWPIAWRIIRESFDNTPADRTFQWRKVLLFAFFMWFSSIFSNLVWSRGELPVANYLLPAETVGNYVKGFSIFSAGVSLIMLGVSGAGQKITRALGSCSDIDAANITETSFSIQLLLSSAVASFFIWFPTELCVLAFGSSNLDCERSLRILAVALPALSVSAQNYFIQVKTNGSFPFITLPLTVLPLYLLAFTLGSRNGVAGIAASRTATLTLVSLLTLIYYRRLCPTVDGKALLALVAAILLQGLSVLLVNSLGTISLPLRAACFLATQLLTAAILPPLCLAGLSRLLKG